MTLYGNDIDELIEGETTPNDLWCHDCRRMVIARAHPTQGIICDRCGWQIQCDYCGHGFMDLDDLDTHEAEEHGNPQSSAPIGT